MRCLQHVLWRGAIALGLLVSGGAGVLALPQAPAPACNARAGLDAAPVAQAAWSANTTDPASTQRSRC